MEKDLEARIRRLEDREEIIALSHRYARAQDRLDHAAQRSVFHDDAWMDYGYFSGGPDEFVAFAQGALRKMGVTQHLLGQIDIDIVSDNEAFGEVYTIAYHRIESPDGDRDLFMSGRYIDRYERRDGKWGIAFRGEVLDWVRDDPAGAGLPEMAATALVSRKGGDDLSQQRERLRRPG